MKIPGFRRRQLANLLRRAHAKSVTSQRASYLDGYTEEMFSLFYRGEFNEVARRCADIPVESLSLDSRHMAYASCVLTAADPSRYRDQLTVPISPVNFRTYFAELMHCESAAFGGSVIDQPKCTNKILLAAAVGLAAGRRFLVETGTYLGSSTLLVADLFEEVWTVEASPQLHQASLALFREVGARNVRAVLGNSSLFLRTIEPSVGDQAVFFLDAHYSSGITSRSFGDCPLVSEIRFLTSHFGQCIIVADDMRTMTGQNGYPNLHEVLSAIPKSWSVSIAFDQLVCLPEAETSFPWTWKDQANLASTPIRDDSRADREV